MDYIKLVISVGACLLVGFISGLFTAKSDRSWYTRLKKPSFNPPGWIFGPVWTFLYILMGISLYLIWSSGGSKTAITFFIIQLALNFLWSLLFFYMKNRLLALIDIALLLIMIISTAMISYPISSTAALLFIPYILWVSFASVLNFEIYRLNR